MGAGGEHVGRSAHHRTRRDEVRVLEIACALAGVVVGITALVPFSPTAPRGLAAVLCGVGLALALLINLRGDRVRPAELHGILGLATALISLCVAASTTPSGTLVTTTAFLWVAMYTSSFHRRAVMLRHLAGIAAGLGLGLVVAGAPSVPQTWFFLMATFGCVAVVNNRRILDLHQEATTDPLTGVLTRRAFRQAAELEMVRATRTGRPLTLALLDLDDFKGINDRHGHAEGDNVLRGLTARWNAALRRDDVIGRFGGDEFVLLLPGADREQAAGILAGLPDDLCRWSAGLATWDGQSLDEWFDLADRDLYEVKGPVPRRT